MTKLVKVVAAATSAALFLSHHAAHAFLGPACTPPSFSFVRGGAHQSTSTRTSTPPSCATAMSASASASTEEDVQRGHFYGYGDPNHVPSILQNITAQRYIDVAEAKKVVSETELRRQVKEFKAAHGGTIDLFRRIVAEEPEMAIAAEFKRASPSKGDIAVGLKAGEQGSLYASVGAAVLSVLTEPKWFKGSLEDMKEVRIATNGITQGKVRRRPVILRKDFIVDEYQLLEARANGADTVLLIVAILEVDRLDALIQACRELEMEPLVEVHTDQEMRIALNAGARVVGVNNRNLHTFELDLETTERVALVAADMRVPWQEPSEPWKKERIVLSALSGITGPDDVKRFEEMGVSMVLVGETLMRAEDPGKAIRALLGKEEPTPVSEQRLVKVCGVTNVEDALAVASAGANLIGVIFADGSPRKVTESRAREIVRTVQAFGERKAPKSIEPPPKAGSSAEWFQAWSRKLMEASHRTPLVVGVFQNQPTEEIQRIVSETGLDLVQLHGDEGIEACAECGVPALRVVHVPAAGEEEQVTPGDGGGVFPSSPSAAARAEAVLAQVPPNFAAGVLLDTSVNGAQGGTGMTFDHEVAKLVGQAGVPVIVAGGLNSGNVELCVILAESFGVDVSSGVERSKGVKDVDEVHEFMEQARLAHKDLAAKDWEVGSEPGEENVGGEESREGETRKWGYDSSQDHHHQQPPPPPPPPTSSSNLLLQRDEYVVRALDAETSEELWFVTVAHFSALDLQGRGGTAALTRATVAAADREGYARAVRARSASSDYLEGLVKALPQPMEEEDGDDPDGWESSTSAGSGGGVSWSFGKDMRQKMPPGGGQQARRRGRFGEEHVDRFPYLLYEDNAFVVAMDPMDGSVLWRKEMPALAVSLYGIRGREWVDILPPPMSMLQAPPGYYPSPSATSLMPQTSFDGSSSGSVGDDWLAGEEIDWSHEDGDGARPLLLLTNGNSGSGGEDSAASCSDRSGGDDDPELGKDASSRYSADGSTRGRRTGCSYGEAGGNDWCADDASTLDDPGKTLVPAAVSKPSGMGGGGKMTGLLQPGLRRGQLQAQVGVVNGHFYVSSSLRRGPLHAAAVEDRYPHPTTGVAGRRPLVDAVGRDTRDGVSGGGGGGAMGLTQMPPHVPKTPPHAARPIDQAAGPTIFFAGDRAGTGYGLAKSNAVSGAGGGRVEIGDWKQDLLDRFEREMMEERTARSKIDVEMQRDSTGFFASWRFLTAHPDSKESKEGLFMTWRAVAVLVGGVIAIVAGVAYLAYKHGATAISGGPSRRGSEDETEDDTEERRRQQQRRRSRRAQTRLSEDFSDDDDGDEGSDDGGGGGSGRSRKSSVAAAGGRGRDRKGGGSRRSSRSPRASVASTEEFVLGAAGGGCGDDLDSAVIGTGGDDKDALLVTNRRLRTEFVEGQKLGKGGFGTVFKCRNRLDGHDYAVKKIRLSSDPRWQPQLEKVLREVKIMSLLDHPNIVRYYQAWLEKFTEEDEELLREEAAPSVVSESWDQTTGGGSRVSHLHHQHNHHTGTGTTAASNKTKTYAYAGGGSGNRGGSRGRGRGANGDGLRGFGGNGFGASPLNSPLFVGLGAAAGAVGGGGGLLQAGGGDDEDGRHWDNWPGLSPRQSASKLATPLFEEQSMDGWSIDSRNADDRGNRGRWRPGEGRDWDDASYREERDVHDEGDDDEEEEEEDEDEDEASMPGFVFDREVSEDKVIRVEGKGEVAKDEEEEEEEEGRARGERAAEDGWLVGESGNEGEDFSGGGGRSSGGGGKHQMGWTEVGERRLSGSVSVAATAAASAYAEDKEGCSEGRVDTTNVYAASPSEAAASPAEKTKGEARTGSRREGGASSDSHDGRGYGSNDDDDSFSWDRARPLPQQNGSAAAAPVAAGSNGRRVHSDASDGEDDEQEASPRPAVEELTLADAPRKRSVAANGQDHRRHGRRAHHHHRSDGEGKAVAAAVAAEEAEEADSKQRPRGQSWPIAAAAATAPSDGGDSAVAAPGGSGVGAGTALDGGKRRARSLAAGAYPAAAAAATSSNRRRSSGKGTWQNERAWGRGNKGGRGKGGSSRRQSKEVYDLWLYIQMQYCSHNNLQYFLDEDPVRRSQTRVDMPQVMHIFMQVARGLQYVHACGLIHRDLKPANCFQMSDGTVKIGDFGLSRHILPADGINGGAVAAAAAAAASAKGRRASFAWESDQEAGGDDSITGGVGTYLYASPEQMSGQGYDEKTDVYSLGMLLFEMCHPPFGTKMERTVVLTNAHRLQFPTGNVWGPRVGQEAMKNMCRSMLQEQSGKRPSAADIVRQVELMQGKHMVLQLDRKPPASYLGADGDAAGRPVDMAVVLRVEALDQEGLLHRLVDRIRALCKGQAGRDDDADGGGGSGGGSGGGGGGGGGGGARLEQYGLRGHTGSAIMEFLIAGAKLEERQAIIAALESLPEVKTVREFPASG
eukprot:g5604.t1